MADCAQQQLTIPALQRVPRRRCVVCAAPAELYCARCELTPYCGQRCQREDWLARHTSVCHNLVRLSKSNMAPEDVLEVEPELSKSNKPSEDVLDLEPDPQPAKPLRKPHSAAGAGAKRDHAPTGHQKNVPSNHTPEHRPTQQTSRAPWTNKPNNNRNDNNSFNKQEKKPADNYRREDSHNGSDTQSNYSPRPPTNQQSNPSGTTNSGHSKSVKPEPQTNVPANRAPSTPLKNTAKEAKATPVQPEPVKAAAKQAVKNVTPEQKLVPKTYLLETMSVGDTVLFSVEASAEDCGTKQAGFVCLCLSESSQQQFERLCVQFAELCAAAERVRSVSPGDSFAYLDSADESWYRARCLSPTSAALLDSCKLVPLVKEDSYTALPAEYAHLPEFSCVLRGATVALGNSLTATLVSKTPSSIKVSLVNAETGASLGVGEVSRWLPDVEYPKPMASAIPEVTRPDVTNNSKVLLVEASAVDRVLVRPADKESIRRFDSLLEDVVMYGMKAQPLTEPPKMGDTVIGTYTDGLQYRALCKRTNVKQNKYLLEYIEFGNAEVAQLERLYACPPELTLTAAPTQVSAVRLQCAAAVSALTPPALNYLEKIRDDTEELVLTIPGGANAASAGAEVSLTVAKNKESINRRVTEMCTPEWKKLEERGGDVLESEIVTHKTMKYLDLPEDGCVLDVLDVSWLMTGNLVACERGAERVKFAHGPLADRMAEYCDSQLGKEPYLPNIMEMCIARCPPCPQWFRAVLVEHSPGAPEASVCYVDYGYVETVPVSNLRKMLPEFIKDAPAIALHVAIKDFPNPPTAQQVAVAIEHMQLTDEGRGTLRATRCERCSNGVYLVHAPALIAAIHAAT